MISERTGLIKALALLKGILSIVKYQPKRVLHEQKEDTNKVKTLFHLSRSYRLHYPDSSLAYAQHALELAEILDYEWGYFGQVSVVLQSFMNI